VEGEALLDCILENTPPLEPLCVKTELNHGEVSSAEAEPIERPLPKPKDPEEGFQPSDLPYFEDNFSKILETPRITHANGGHQSRHSLRFLRQRIS
jgi:hypothetical protein